jgi:acyl-CoA reductase-like NAD-dependent aldehyde dehydrogenase
MYLDASVRSAGEGSAVHDRWTGEVIGEVSRDGPAEVDAAVTVLAGRGRPPHPSQRAAILSATAASLDAQAERFSRLITAESGVCRAETIREVARASANLRIAAIEAERIRGETIPLPNAPRLAITVPEPIGVVAGITPFNRPLNQVVVKVAPALAAGCPVALKPSEKTPLTALAFADLLTGAGCPGDMLAVLTGEPGEIGPALAGHPGVDMVTFTGSVATGRAVAGAAAGKKLLLELGGNDPLLVLPDADLPAAARLAAAGACATAGQSCRGIKRIIVWQEVADAFVELLAAAVAGKRCGDPHRLDTVVGPLISEEAARLVERRIAAAVGAGALLVTGGGRSGALLQPAVLDRVPPAAELVREETFGPVAPVLRVAGVDEAVAVANGTPYGLQAGVLTNDSAGFWELAARLRVGAVNLGEGPHFDSPYIPFGGVKASGVGREGIRYAIAEMTAVKTVTVPYLHNEPDKP